MADKLLAFPWFGGKYIHIDFLRKYMPADIDHFVDVFGGSASVIINMPPCRVKTYNDINGEIVNFFRVLRDKHEELLPKIHLTPFARDEFGAALEDSPADISDVERARRFFVRVRQSRNAMEGQPGLTARQWRRSAYCDRSLAAHFGEHADNLLDVVHVFKPIQIENDPAVKIIKGLDSPTVFFYCDPPYLSSTRSGGKAYRHEMTEAEHIEFAETLTKCEARAMISGYRSKLYDELFADWTRIDDKPYIANTTRNAPTQTARVESIWINYEPPQQSTVKQEALELC